MRRQAISLIALYQRAISPYVPGQCRYDPTCSRYAQEAIERYGVVRGVWMGIRRLLRCHPLGGRGYDPVPQPVAKATSDIQLTTIKKGELAPMAQQGKAPRS